MSRGYESDIVVDLPRGQEYPNIYIYGAITDPHMHPRNFDTLLPQQPSIPNGKAGLELYTRGAVLGGISRGGAMPNEFLRYYDPEEPDGTKVVPYFITTVNKLRAFAHDISTESHIPMAIFFGVERESVGLSENQEGFSIKNIDNIFAHPEVKALTKGLKIYGGDTTGGPAIQIPLEYIIPIAEVWHKHNPEKPIILHLEDEDVATILEKWPKHILVHIAHVSSQKELEAKMRAKELGVDITCEATFHHLGLTVLTQEIVGPYGCVKPTLKLEDDRKYLWANKEEIDMFASDCAPHRKIDKVGLDGKGLEKPAFGITSHDVFMAYFLNQLVEGNLTERQLHDRLVKNAAERFRLPPLENITKFILQPVTYHELSENVKYGCSPLGQSEAPEVPKFTGRLIYIAQRGGNIIVNQGVLGPGANPTYKNLIRAA
jgi:hypothetical protein